MRGCRVAGQRCLTVRFVTDDFNTLTRKESNLKTSQNCIKQSISKISLRHQYIVKHTGDENPEIHQQKHAVLTNYKLRKTKFQCYV